MSILFQLLLILLFYNNNNNKVEFATLTKKGDQIKLNTYSSKEIDAL